MTYRILVPAGIGDFSWLWNKLSTTPDKFFVEYTYMAPDRLGAFLALLPKDKIEGWSCNRQFKCTFNVTELEMKTIPWVKKLERYEELGENAQVVMFTEANTHLERGGRIENWLPDLNKINFHYKIEGLLTKCAPQDIFIVHLSSFKVKSFWHYYDIVDWCKMIAMIQKKTGWLPVFIGGAYDDFAQACFEEYVNNNRAVSLIGRTEDLLGALCLIQQSKLFLGCVSSGLTALANVMYVPSISWWPREKLAQSWPDLSVPYKWFLWKDPIKDTEEIEQWLKNI